MSYITAEIDISIPLDDIIERVIDNIKNDLEYGLTTPELLENELYDIVDNFIYDILSVDYKFDCMNTDEIIFQIRASNLYQTKLSEILDNYYEEGNKNNE